MKNDGLKNISFVGIGRIVGLSLQAIFYLIFAALLEPDVYGELNIILALAGTYSVISQFGLHATLQIYLAKGRTDLTEQINTLFVISTGVASLILLTQNVVASILCFSLSLFVMDQRTLLGLRKYKKFMTNSILRGILSITIPFGFYFVLGIPGIVLGLALSQLVISIPYLRIIKIKSFIGLRYHYKVILHNFGVTASDTLPVMVDKLLIGVLFELFIVGVYQFNLQILLALGILPGIVSSFLISEESVGSKHKKLVSFSIILSILFAIFVIILGPYFVNNLFPKYSDGVFPLQVLSISIIPMTINAVLKARLMSRESTKIGFSVIIRIGVLFGLIIFLGEVYGLLGLSIAVLVSILCNTVFLSVLYKESERKLSKY